MKFYCDKCNAKYSIADEKVRGKILKVRCKKCTNIITVREPRTPVAQAPETVDTSTASPLRPPAHTPIPWYYSVNGQTFGPFPLDKLQAMYAAGDVGDASYVWNETFTAWLPVREVREFSEALSAGTFIRPSSMTLGATGQIEAIRAIDARPNQAEEGFVPGASAPSSQLSDRLEGLRGKLQKPANPFAAESAPIEQDEISALEDATVQSSAAEINALLQAEEETSHAPEPEPFSLPPRPSLLDDDDGLEAGVAPPVTASSSPDGFRGIESAQFPSLSRESVETPAVHEGLFQEIQVDTPIGDEDDFAPSQSLLIELDSIQKKGRSKRVAMIAAAASIFVVLGATAAVLAYRNSQNKPDSEVPGVKVAQKDELVFHTYSKKELKLMELEDEVLTEEESRLMFEEEEGTTVKNPTKTSPKLATNTKPKRKTDIRPKNSGLNIRGPVLKSNSGSAFDDALNSSSKAGSSSGKGLRSSGSKEGAGKAITGSSKTKRKGSDTKWDRLKIGSAARPRRVYRPTDNIGASKAPKGPGFGSTKLSKSDAKAGFAKVRRSVGFCRQRQSMRGLPLAAQKITITVEIQGTGSVSGLSLSPSSVQNTEFHNCMKSHKSRWRFVAYNGKPVKIKHTYVLQ